MKIVIVGVAVVVIVKTAEDTTPFAPVALTVIEYVPPIFGRFTVTPELLAPVNVEPVGDPPVICHVTVPVLVAVWDMENEYAPV